MKVLAAQPEYLVSSCRDGEVKKTSTTIFEMEAQDWWPPWDRKLEILILNRQESMEGNVG